MVELGLLLIALLGWFWYASLRVRERAQQSCLRFCQREGVKLLDDTVALDRLWFQRGRDGRLRIERRYTFEFSQDGVSRSGGIVVMLGDQVQLLALDGGDLLIS
jgi:hypothetical protein